ncbi:hypothetical protein BUALT_Bualt08G0060500 [Buddleja alternifolia]|uniref:Uncharacterized protein n=1 Tax=Buddleja alternifolia TaxID=168488 RepID=A0AAV6XC58_9LAMI|nr:hypothetical protein BUALT_Bualt08G0060500 [Buddleja alternifolia]
MSKVLISRLELITDHNKATLGENGAIEPFVKMFNAGNLEAKLSALNALQNLSNSKQNIHRLINLGIVISLLHLLFSITSILMTLREPASTILAKVAQSESILIKQDVAPDALASPIRNIDGRENYASSPREYAHGISSLAMASFINNAAAKGQPTSCPPQQVMFESSSGCSTSELILTLRTTGLMSRRHQFSTPETLAKPELLVLKALRTYIGLLGLGKSLQKDLNRIAETADTSPQRVYTMY